MQQIKWTSEMLLGVPEMDCAHKSLVEELGRLASVPYDQFSAGFYCLIDTFKRDFREEEALMEKIAFPARRSHREQHARVLNGLLHVDPLVKQGDIDAGREVVKQLPMWFLMHLSTMDLMLAIALDMVSASKQPPPSVYLRTARSSLLNCMDNT